MKEFPMDTTALLAGAAGGLVRWITLRDSWLEGLSAVVVGAVCAQYLGPIVEPLLEPTIGAIAPGDDADGFAHFIVGLSGVGLTGLVIDLMSGRPFRGNSDEK